MRHCVRAKSTALLSNAKSSPLALSIPPERPFMIDSADSDSRIDLTSPLAGRESGGVLDMREIAARGKIILRGDAADAAFCEAAQKTLGSRAAANAQRDRDRDGGGCPRPLARPRRMDGVVRLAAAVAIARRFANGAQPLRIAPSSMCPIITRSSARAGAHVRAALAHGCPLDLDNFAVDSCAQTRFRRAAVMLFRAADRDGEPVFEIQTRWSFADYVWRVLARAGELTAAAARAGD